MRVSGQLPFWPQNSSDYTAESDLLSNTLPSPWRPHWIIPTSPALPLTSHTSKPRKTSLQPSHHRYYRTWPSLVKTLLREDTVPLPGRVPNPRNRQRAFLGCPSQVLGRRVSREWWPAQMSMGALLLSIPRSSWVGRREYGRGAWRAGSGIWSVMKRCHTVKTAGSQIEPASVECDWTSSIHKCNRLRSYHLRTIGRSIFRTSRARSHPNTKAVWVVTRPSSRKTLMGSNLSRTSITRPAWSGRLPWLIRPYHPFICRLHIQTFLKPTLQTTLAKHIINTLIPRPSPRFLLKPYLHLPSLRIAIQSRRWHRRTKE